VWIEFQHAGLEHALLVCNTSLEDWWGRFSMGVRFDAGVCGEGARMWMRARVRRDSFIDWANLAEGRDTYMGGMRCWIGWRPKDSRRI
jgi:hypothetical protein